MKKNLFNIFLFFCISNQIQSQGPGFLGKKLVFGYSLNTSPALWGSSANYKTILGTEGTAPSGHFAFNFIHEGSLECSISTKWAIGINARYYKTKFDNATFLTSTSNGITFSQRATPSGYYDITGLSYGIYFKVFRPTFIAPWGKYIVFGPVFNTAKATYDPNIMNIVGRVNNSTNNYSYNYKDTIISDFGPPVQKYKGFNFLFGWGRSRIIANKIVIDYGCNMYLLSFFPNLALTSKNNLSNTNYIHQSINRRIRGVNHFNVFLKIGFLF